MATIPLVKFGFLQPILPIPTPGIKVRKSTIRVPPPTIQKRNEVRESELLESSSAEFCQKVHVQDLVDHLHGCVKEGLLGEAKAIHGYVLKSNFEDASLLILLNHVIHAYSKCSDFVSAKAVFDTLTHRNTFSWTGMIVGSMENGFPNEGLNYFLDMLDSGMMADAFAYSVVLRLCIGLDCVELGKMLHAQIVVRGFTTHVVVGTSLLNMYAKLGEVEHSCQVFDDIGVHNEVSWNALISGLTANGLHPEAYERFLEMKKEGFSPDKYTLASVLRAVGMLGDVNKGKQVHKYISEQRLESNILVGTALIDMYSRCGVLPDARSVFDLNFTNCGVNVPWNALISGYSRSKFSQEALELYVKMCQNSITSDIHTYCSVFDAIADLKYLGFLKEVHGMVLKCAYHSTALSVQNAVADAYSKCGYLEDMRKVFDSMMEKDIVSWTTLISAYSQSFEPQKAIESFFLMREGGFKPNQFTFASVLVACAALCFLEFGSQLHGLLYKSGFGTEKCVESALVDMYAKCGCIAEAALVFDCISEPDVISWTAIISAYAQHGFAVQALKHFKMMEQLGIKINAVTLLCVLFACSHGGMVEEGLNYFWSMEKSYGLVPDMQHYACIVDLLGRVGRLKEAFEFIRKMPIEPDEIVWQTLLAACRVHGNVELGEIAAKKIISLQPEHPATYVLLSNTYMEKGSLRDGLYIRNEMKDLGVKKEPGVSWICLNGRVHKFYSGDQQHPQKNDIYLKLESLNKKIKDLGYTADLRFALQGGD